MSVKISGALIDGAGIPMSGCQIILKARVNTAEVVRTIATITMEGNGEYSFDFAALHVVQEKNHVFSRAYVWAWAVRGDIKLYGFG